MIVLHMDLDNTVIYSYKHDIGEDKRNVEIYHEREISFITGRTYELLQEVNKRMLMVPTSTRSIEQYKRINLGLGSFKYALVCNGGILLVDGERDEEWYKESLRLASHSIPELNKALKLLDKDERRTFELRFIEDLFVFTKCESPQEVVIDLKKSLDADKVDVFNNGIKVYVVPKNLSKGAAVYRFRKYFEPELVVAAGDSEFDISMLESADIGLAPYNFSKDYGIDFKVREAGKGELFSEAFLNECLVLTL